MPQLTGAFAADGGAWGRLCSKMATGSGKTTVMAMIITWQVLNALAYPIVAPGLTVKERLRVLCTGDPGQLLRCFRAMPFGHLDRRKMPYRNVFP